MSPEDQVTPVSEWRRESNRGVLLPLPSGKVVRVARTLDLPRLMRLGLIPNHLVELFSEQMAHGRPRPEQVTPEAIDDVNKFIDQLVASQVTEPKVYLVPDGEDAASWVPDDENGISIADLSVDDKGYIFMVAQGGATDLDSFRIQSAASMAAMADVTRVADPAVSPAGTENRAERRAKSKGK